jgi:hypothetical protein
MSLAIANSDDSRRATPRRVRRERDLKTSDLRLFLWQAIYDFSSDEVEQTAVLLIDHVDECEQLSPGGLSTRMREFRDKLRDVLTRPQSP